MINGTVISLVLVNRSFGAGGGPGGDFRALKEVSLTFERGTLVALKGPSGSGKSTLLNLIAGIDRATSGSITVASRELTRLSEDELARYRGSQVGVVFQFFQLLPTLTVLENVILPMELVGQIPSRQRKPRAMELLDRVGISDQSTKLPTTLSGGQQQRVAIARALANDPPILVADEPTGNLDSETAAQVFELLSTLPALNKTVIMATHEKAFLQRFDRVIQLRDGRVTSDTRSQDREKSSKNGGVLC